MLDTSTYCIRHHAIDTLLKPSPFMLKVTLSIKGEGFRTAEAPGNNMT